MSPYRHKDAKIAAQKAREASMPHHDRDRLQTTLDAEQRCTLLAEAELAEAAKRKLQTWAWLCDGCGETYARKPDRCIRCGTSRFDAVPPAKATEPAEWARAGGPHDTSSARNAGPVGGPGPGAPAPELAGD